MVVSGGDGGGGGGGAATTEATTNAIIGARSVAGIGQYLAQTGTHANPIMVGGVVLIIHLAVNGSSRQGSSIGTCACSASARDSVIGGSRFQFASKLIVAALAVANGPLNQGNRVRHAGQLLRLLVMLWPNNHGAAKAVKTIVAIAILWGRVTWAIQFADVALVDGSSALIAVPAVVVARNAVAAIENSAAAAWCG